MDDHRAKEVQESEARAAVLDHLGIAVHSIEDSLHLYRTLGMTVSAVEEVAHERVRVAMLQAGESRIELLESTEDGSAVGRFLAKRGEGLHHVAPRVPNLERTVAALKQQGVRLVPEAIQRGTGGHRYVFVHPESANGVLLELVEADGQEDTGQEIRFDGFGWERGCAAAGGGYLRK